MTRYQNPRSNREPVAHRIRFGFSLIEAAIVLAVIGLVIGGIWVAAASITDKLKWQRTEAGWLYYLTEVRKAYNARDVNNDTCAIHCNIWPFIASLPPPTGWSRTTTGAFDPYGKRLNVEINDSSGAYMGYSWVTVEKKQCARVKHMMVTRMQKIAKIVWTDWVGGCGSLPKNPGASTVDYYYNNCCTGAPGEVGAYFEVPNR